MFTYTVINDCFFFKQNVCPHAKKYIKKWALNKDYPKTINN